LLVKFSNFEFVLLINIYVNNESFGSKLVDKMNVKIVALDFYNFL